MFYHNFKYAFKTLFRDKMLIFWTFAFPIILGTFFNMAFSNIENSEKLDIISIAIVEKEENEIMKQAFETLSDEENEDRLFKTQYVTEEKAKELLENDEITGYLVLLKEEPKVVIKSNGINETILKYVTEEIMQNTEMISNIVEKRVQESMQGYPEGIYNMPNMENIYEDVMKMLEDNQVEFKNISNSNLSYTMIEFYTLIAMTCLYGGILGMTAIMRKKNIYYTNQ